MGENTSEVSVGPTPAGLTELQAKRKADREAEEARWAEERRVNELPFAELTVDQKFERMTNYMRGFDYWRNKVSTLERELTRFKKHSHNGSEVVIPIDFDRHGGELSVGSSLSNRHPLD